MNAIGSTTDRRVRGRWLALFAAVALLAFAAGTDSGAAAAADLKSLRGEATIPETGTSTDLPAITEGNRQERAYRQQPPLIPHRIDKYEMDLKVNQCLRCHDWPYSTKENAPKISETHYVGRDGTRLDKVARTRWFCTQCHVPQTDARPLVENDFKSVIELQGR